MQYASGTNTLKQSSNVNISQGLDTLTRPLLVGLANQNITINRARN